MGKFVALVLVSAVFVLCFLWYTSTACFGTSLCGGEALEGQSAVTPGRTLQNDTVDNAHTTQKTLLSNVNRSVNEVTEKISEKLGRAETIPRNKTKKTCRRSRKGKGHVEKQQESNVTNAGSAIRKYHLETEPTPGDKHIMFIETSCLLDSSQNSKYPGLVLNKRQVCAIESAAKMNPRHKVYLLHSCPICGRLEDSSEHVQTLFTYPNVYLWKLDRKRHFSKTPLEKWNFQSAIKTSLWPKEHSSDVLRFLTLWKYGGTYLDLDFVILKSLDALGTNYVGLESENTAGSSVLRFARDGLGHSVADGCVQELKTNFRGDVWGHNGPGVITRVLLRMCNCSQVAQLSTERCKGFQILSHREFFPIPYQSWQLLFNESTSKHIMDIIKESFGVHVWNKLSKNTTVTVGSQQPYALMAARACPRMYALCGGYF